MNMAKIKTDKQILAAELLAKLPAVSLTKIKVPQEPRSNSLSVCIVNNILYIQVGQLLVSFGVPFFKTKSDSGEITHHEAMPVLVKEKGQLSWIVSVDTLRRYAEEIDDSRSFRTYKGHLIDFLDSAAIVAKEKIDEIEHYYFNDGAIDQMHSIYRQRNELLAQIKQEETERLAQQFGPMETEDTTETESAQNSAKYDDLTLNELVERIEAMGWIVTLRRKGSEADEVTSASPVPSTSVPKWYDENKYKLLKRSLENTDLSVGTLKRLADVGIKTIGHLAKMSKSQLLEIPSFGGKKLTEVDDFLDALGLTFQMDLSAWERAHEASIKGGFLY